jgi:acyl-CoA thioesterase
MHPVVAHMLENDAFSRWLKLEVMESVAGKCIIECRIREEMTNGFKVAHGGIGFSLADSALAFAANAYGEKAMSIECTISYLKAVKAGSLLRVEALEKHRSKRLGRYEIALFSDGEQVGLFYGVVMFLGENWENIG